MFTHFAFWCLKVIIHHHTWYNVWFKSPKNLVPKAGSRNSFSAPGGDIQLHPLCSSRLPRLYMCTDSRWIKNLCTRRIWCQEWEQRHPKSFQTSVFWRIPCTSWFTLNIRWTFDSLNCAAENWVEMVVGMKTGRCASVPSGSSRTLREGNLAGKRIKWKSVGD